MSLRDTYKGVLTLSKSPKMLSFIPYCAWTAFSLSYYSGILVLEISCTIDNENCGAKDPENTNEKAMLAMVALGVGSMLGGQLIGQIIDHKGSKTACLAVIAIMVVLGATTITFLAVNTYNVIVFFTTFMWGFQDSASNTHS